MPGLWDRSLASGFPSRKFNQMNEYGVDETRYCWCEELYIVLKHHAVRSKDEVYLSDQQYSFNTEYYVGSRRLT